MQARKYDARAWGKSHNMRKVLIVDDEENLRSGFHAFIEHYGCAVRSCESGDEAVALAAKFKPDVLLCDLNLGSESGIEVAKQVRRSFPNCKIVLMSGIDIQQVKSDSDTLFIVLQKPIELDDLLAAVGIQRDGTNLQPN
ncbi:MAG TPA: response regulator [Terriglobales bacterium]